MFFINQKRSQSDSQSFVGIMDTLIIKNSYLFVIFYVLFQSLYYSYAATGPDHGKVVVCYIGTWAVYRPEKGSFSIENIDASLCTHVVYAFVGLNSTHDDVRSLDPWQDLTENYGKGGFNRLTSLKQRYPHLKITLAIGGWNEGSANYSSLVANPARRGRFVANALEFVRKYNFDGLDLDWEFPGKRGGAPQDKQNFLLLVKELRSAFNKLNYLLTAAFGAGKDTIDIAYDVANLSKYLDFVHLMCYDYHGAWDLKTGANAPLRGHPGDVLSVEYSIKYMIELGMDPSKLVMGLPLYGRTFLLNNLYASNEIPKLGALAKNVGFQGPYTRENGFMGYNEICIEVFNETNGWTTHWDEISMTPFAVNGDKVITFDDEKSITEKVKFSVKEKLAGAMVWSIDTDDFLGDCSLLTKDKFANFPLMRTINIAISDALKDQKIDEENEIPHEDHRDHKMKSGASRLINTSICLVIFTLFFY